MLIAITRAVSPAINRCELTHLERVPISFERAASQHRAYEALLRALGVEVVSLPVELELPDSVFVEDVAVVFEECAILARPGAESRRPECESVARALTPYREILRIEAPGTLDGGDVLTVGRAVYVGLTTRSNAQAVDQMKAMLAPLGYAVSAVPIAGGLHLKSGVSVLNADTLLINPEWVSRSHFGNMRFIEADPSEPRSANVLTVGETIVCQPAWPKTQARLEAAGFRTMPVDESELAKAEGALTCCSLLFEA